MCFLLFVLNSTWVRLEELHFSLTSFFKEVVKLVEAVVFSSDVVFALVSFGGSQSLACIGITSLEVSLGNVTGSVTPELLIWSAGMEWSLRILLSKEY